MSRSLKKGPYVDERLLKKISTLKKGDKTIIKTWRRAQTITPEMDLSFLLISGMRSTRAQCILPSNAKKRRN